MKYFLSILLAFVMVANFVSCSNTENGSGSTEPAGVTAAPGTTGASDTKPNGSGTTTGTTVTPPTPNVSGTVYSLNETATWVKRLDPRMQATANGITCDWSAAGIEFVATGKGDMVFALSVSTNMGGGKEGCFFRAYVDGAAYPNGESLYYEVKKGDATITLKNLPDGTHTVRLVKVTGYTLSNTLLKSVTFEGTVAQNAPDAKNLLIEFVGDSICCGWGVIGDHNGAYSDQDATLAYPYLVADTLGADLSVVALSGQGLTIGNPGILAGYKYASPSRSMKTEYGFERKADYVVINAGTNDAFNGLSVADFEAKLQELVTYVREKNGDKCHIILVAGMMKTEYNSTVSQLATKLGGAEAKYYAYVADQAKNGNHPNIDEQKAYAEALSGMIDAIAKGTYVEQDSTPRLPVNVTTVWSQNFDTATTPGDAGITHTITPTCAAGGLPMEIKNGKLAVSKHDWHQSTPDYYATLVDADTLAGAQTYLLEMDVEFTELHVFTLILNGNKALSKTNRENNQAGALAVSMRLAVGNGYGKGPITNPIVTNYISFNDQGGDQKEVLRMQPTIDVSEAKESVSFRLSVLVENTGNGCCVKVFINGEFSSTCTYDTLYNPTENSAVILWAQNTAMTIDNMSLSIPAAN